MQFFSKILFYKYSLENHRSIDVFLFVEENEAMMFQRNQTLLSQHSSQRVLLL